MPHQKSAQVRQFEQTVNKFQSLINELKDTLELMPQKGSTTKECQKLCIQKAINDLEANVNGIQESDFIANSYSGNFKLSYSGTK
jgi:hypothetical protein